MANRTPEPRERPGIVLRRVVCYEAGADAGNRSMRARVAKHPASGHAWTADDLNAAAERSARLAVYGGFLSVAAYEQLGFGVHPSAQVPNRA